MVGWVVAGEGLEEVAVQVSVPTFHESPVVGEVVLSCVAYVWYRVDVGGQVVSFFVVKVGAPGCWRRHGEPVLCWVVAEVDLSPWCWWHCRCCFVGLLWKILRQCECVALWRLLLVDVSRLWKWRCWYRLSVLCWWMCRWWWRSAVCGCSRCWYRMWCMLYSERGRVVA